jgi:hypothetical protein
MPVTPRSPEQDQKTGQGALYHRFPTDHGRHQLLDLLLFTESSTRKLTFHSNWPATSVEVTQLCIVGGLSPHQRVTHLVRVVEIDATRFLQVQILRGQSGQDAGHYVAGEDRFDCDVLFDVSKAFAAGHRFPWLRFVGVVFFSATEKKCNRHFLWCSHGA